MNMIKAVIIEDDLNGIEVLKYEIKENWPEVSVKHEFSSYTKAVEWLQLNDIDLVFLDIELGPHNGMDLFDDIRENDFDVIIISGNKDHAALAFRHNVVDYLLKPIEPTELIEAKKKYKDKSIKKEDIHALMSSVLLNSDKGSDKISISTADGLIVMDLKDIFALQADRNYTRIECDDKSYFSSHNLGFYEKKLGNKGFIRISRNHLVSIHRIKRLGTGKTPEILLDNGKKYVVSARKRHEVRSRLLLL